MAELLYKLGRFSARRAWVVITTWILLLAALGGTAVAFSGKLSTAMSVNGLKSQAVADSLEQTFPAAAKANGKVVFHKNNGLAFTASEISEINSLLAATEQMPAVDSVTNPFKVDAEKSDQLQELADGVKKLQQAPDKLADAQKKIDDGRVKLEDAEAELAANETKVRDGIKQVKAGLAQLALVNPAPPQVTAQIAALQAQLTELNAGLAKIEDGKTELAKQTRKLESGQAKIDKALAELPEQSKKLAAGQTIADAAAKFEVVSDNRETAVATIVFTKGASKVETTEKDAVVEQLKTLNLSTVDIEFSQEMLQSLDGILGVGEIVGLVIAAVVLFMMLGTLIGAGLPVLSAILGVAVSAAITLSLSSVFQMTTTTPTLGVMLGLAVGIDYSLFVINRHRRQLKAGMELRESIAMANGTSGSAVLFAGMTVIIALVALHLTGIDFLSLMGDFAAVAIAIGVLIAVTFTPALLSLVGLKILSRKERSAVATALATSDESKAKVAAEVLEKLKKPVFATKHPYVALIATITVLVIAALPMSQLRLGLPDGSTQPLDSTQYRAFSLISKEFGAGQNGQVVAVANLETAKTDDEITYFQAEVVERIIKLDSVRAVVPAAVSDDNKSVLFAVLPEKGPASAETEKLVADLRALEPIFASDYKAELGVTGMTAVQVDMSEKMADALPLYLVVVLTLSMILLIMVFRSIAVPVIASLGFLLTITATLGAEVAVYQWQWLGWLFDVHDPGVVLNMVPTMLVGILFGLAMDYQLFLVSGMREAYVHGDSPRDAVNHGVRSGRAVVVAAAIIMVTVFGGFAFSHLSMVRPIGLGLAVGVLADAFLVRLLLVPATMHLLGKAAWWIPKWLDRILPDLDIEGAKLERRHGH